MHMPYMFLCWGRVSFLVLPCEKWICLERRRKSGVWLFLGIDRGGGKALGRIFHLFIRFLPSKISIVQLGYVM